jgi:hypothetical protein
MLKFLQYEQVNGTQDRDDTMFVAKIESSEALSSGRVVELDAIQRDRRGGNGELDVAAVIQSRLDRRKSEETV